MKTEVQIYSTDLSTISMVTTTPEEMEQLQKDLDEFFRPCIDPLDMNKETMLRAEEELNENPNTVLENIEKLRDLITADPDMHTRTDDVFLCGFLRGKKHNIQRAFDSYRNAYEFKAKYLEFYQYLDKETFAKLANQAYVGSLPGLDRDGRKILVVQAGKLIVDIPVPLSFRLCTGYLELMMSDLDIQVNGFVIILDATNISLMQAAYIATPKNAWHMITALQDKMPIRVKRIHIVNQPFYYKAVYAIFKPFLKKKLKKRLMWHGNDWESLHKEIPPEQLPIEYGGTRPPFKSHLTMSIIEMNLHKFQDWTRFHFNIQK